MKRRAPLASEPPIDAELYGLFRADVHGGPASSVPIDPVLPDHLFVALSAADPSPFASSSTTYASSHASSAGAAGAPSELPAIGSIIDKYRLEAVLGTGGFGVVYRATHLLLQRTVALKLLRAKLLRGRPDLAVLLREEARFAAKISHPNVVSVFDVTHTPQITYVVMEYVDGTTLARLVRERGPLPPETVVSIGLDVTSGLDAALAEGLIHRDIKPQNIILARSGAAKILDLGLARSVASFPGGDLRGKNGYVGTFAYMAPEQALHPDRVDFRADVYSLGVTLYHAATGAPPFPVHDAAACTEMHRSAPVPPPEKIAPGIPPQLSRLFLWMLAKRPAERPPSYAALADALRGARAALASPRPTRMDRGPRR